MKTLLLILAATAMTAPATAAITTVNFQEYGATAIVSTATSAGYTFSAASGALAVIANGSSCATACAANGTTALAFGGANLSPSGANPMTMTGAAPFRLLGFDFGEFVQGGDPANAATITLTGNVFGGGTITTTVTLDGVNDGPGGGADFQTTTLGAFASSLLSSVEFTGLKAAGGAGGYQLDNLLVDTADEVPEPAMLGLFGLSAIGLGLARRRKA